MKTTAEQYNQQRLEAGDFTPERLTTLTEAFQLSLDLQVDGKFGPNTKKALDEYRKHFQLPNSEPSKHEWPAFSGPIRKLPTNRYETYQVFGNPGAGKVDSDWQKANIVSVKNMPGLDRWFDCHRLAEPYFREGFRRAQIARPDYKIERAGGFVFRHIRHDPSRPLSTHAFGCAVDLNPKQNKAVEFPKKNGPEAWSPEWLKIWPHGMPPEVVEAFQSVGFTWGSDWDNDGAVSDHDFYDPMHFELVVRG